jgi:hypothetical protein
MWTGIALFLLKTLCNFLVPYAIIWEAVVRPEKKHGWSIFILLDVGLLVLTVITSAVAGQRGMLSPSRIALYGLGAIVVTYVNMISVLLVGGCTLWLFGLLPKDDRDKP